MLLEQESNIQFGQMLKSESCHDKKGMGQNSALFLGNPRHWIVILSCQSRMTVMSRFVYNCSVKHLFLNLLELPQIVRSLADRINTQVI